MPEYGVNIKFGQDSEIVDRFFSQTDQADPSGFGRVQFPERRLEDLRQFVGEQVSHVYDHAPQELIDLAPSELSIYAVPASGKTAAQVVLRSPNLSLESPTNKTTTKGLLGVRGVRIFPIALQSWLKGNRAQLASVLRHEAAHFLIPNAFFAAQSIDESFSSRIEHELVEAHGDHKFADTWDTDGIRGSCGLRPPIDFVAVEHCHESSTVLYQTCNLALRHIASEAVWNIALALEKKAHAENTCPTFNDIRDAITGEVPSQSSSILSSVPFREIKQGVHNFVLPILGGKEVFVGTYMISRNPNFLQQHSSGGTDDRIAIITPDKQEAPYVARGSKIPEIRGKFTLAGWKNLDFAALSNGISSVVGPTLNPAMIESIDINIGQFPITLSASKVQ